MASIDIEPIENSLFLAIALVKLSFLGELNFSTVD